MINRFERFSYAISEISRHWHKLAAEEMEKHGLKGPHCVYLLTMYRYPQGITATKLCEECGKDKADVSRMMAIMEQKGLVTRQSIHQNLYRGTFCLTESGRAAAEHVRTRASLAVELAGRDLSEENRKIFYDALELITANLRMLSRQGLPGESSRAPSDPNAFYEEESNTFKENLCL